ncbi:hypothetical protein CHUUTOTORO_01710 [Serratia phage vB_SmaM-ChuuTotoro]|nr:hypothetical protein CHUUTOTORO_01710 [Serratia phage vB_SmaM-ChuuTotoro]
MITFSQSLKNSIFEGEGFRVFWSKRGHWTTSSEAGSLPGAGRGYIESCGETISESIANMEAALLMRREELQQKLIEVDSAIEEIRADGYLADELESVAEKKPPQWGAVIMTKAR